MPPNNAPETIEPIQSKKYLKPLLVILVLCIALAAAFFWYQSKSTDINTPAGTPVTLAPFESKLILSLASTIKDNQGIPYTGTVIFDPAAGTYTPIANTDKGNITQLGTAAFTQGDQYLAMRNSASSSDLVIYNKSTLDIDRVVTAVPAGSLIGTAFWSPNSEKLGYLMVGTTKAELVVENADGTNQATLKANHPIGFSPDAKKLLVRAVPALQIIDLATKEPTNTTGSAFVDTDSIFTLSQSGSYLVAYTDQQIDWYRVNWETADITLLGTIPTKTNFADVLFTSEDTLFVRNQESNLTIEYEYKEGAGIVQKSAFDITLATGAAILKVLTW